VTCKDAPNFEELFRLEEPYMYNTKMNKWVIIGGDNWDIYPVCKYIEVGYYPKTIDFVSDMFCGVLNNMEHTKKPIFCANERSKTYYYKTNDKWEEIDYKKLTKRIYNSCQSFMNNLIINTRRFSKMYPNEFYKTYLKDGDFLHRNSGELCLTTWIGLELELFTRSLHNKLSKVVSKEKAEFEESIPHHWNEYKDKVEELNDSDSD